MYFSRSLQPDLHSPSPLLLCEEGEEHRHLPGGVEGPQPGLPAAQLLRRVWTLQKICIPSSPPSFSGMTSGTSLVEPVSSLPSCSSSQLMKTSNTRRGLKFLYSNNAKLNLNQNQNIPICVGLSQEFTFCSISKALIVPT